MAEIGDEGSKELVSGKTTSFRSETLTYGNFVDQVFDGVDFSRSEARLSRYVRCDFLNCAFDSADLQLSRFEDCSFKSHKQGEQRTGNMSSTHWSHCEFYIGCEWGWPHVSFRSAVFENCVFGKVAFEATTIEDAKFINCSFEEISIVAGIVSRAQFENCQFGKVKFSLAAFLSIFGSHQFLATDHISLHTSSSGRELLASGRDNAIIKLKSFLRDSFSILPLSYVVNGIIEIAELEDAKTSVRDKVINVVISYLNSDDIELVQRTDEMETTLGLLTYHRIYDRALYVGSLALLQAIHSTNIVFPAKLVDQFERRVNEYGSNVDPKFVVVFSFKNLDYDDGNDLLAAIDWVRAVARIDRRLHADNISVSPGSVDIQMLVDLLEADIWKIVLAWLFIKTDPHRLLDQMKDVVVDYRASKTEKKRLEEFSIKADLHVSMKEADYIVIHRNDKSSKKLIDRNTVRLIAEG